MEESGATRDRTARGSVLASGRAPPMTGTPNGAPGPNSAYSIAGERAIRGLEQWGPPAPPLRADPLAVLQGSSAHRIDRMSTEASKDRLMGRQYGKNKQLSS